MVKSAKEGLVAQAVLRLRERVVGQEPDTLIGSLPDIARQLGVGVVTVQQAARVLEHEGFLKVRRGNGGGFYGTRPTADALSRALVGFLQTNRTHEREAIDMMTLLDCELIPAAALATDEPLRDRLRDHARLIDACDTAGDRASFESVMQDILYKMVDRPLMELLARMTMQHRSSGSKIPVYSGTEGSERWKRERHDIIAAILKRDPGLARFEAQRRRDDMLRRLGARDAV